VKTKSDTGKYLHGSKRRLDAVDLDRDQVLARFENAVRRLDKLEADLPILKASLERGIKEKDCEILRKVRNRVETEVKETYAGY
jgi:hypothetical protein